MWRRVEKGVPHDGPERRFGDTMIGLRDPHGLRLELVGSRAVAGEPGWAGDVPAEHAIRGFFGVTLWLGHPAATAEGVSAGVRVAAEATQGTPDRFSRAG